MSLKRLLFLILIAALAASALRKFVVESIYIASGSMEPTLRVGHQLWLDKMTLRWRDPRRGEIIILRAPDPPREDMGKRVVAVGGDSVEIRAKIFFLNGEEQDEDYVQHKRADEKLVGDNLGPMTVPEDHFFVLGDNRDESNDSAVWKRRFVSREDIRGLVRGVY